MTPFLSRLTGLLLVLVVALTSVELGAARGQAKAAGEIILCTGDGPVAVVVDADGKPLNSPHVCPDCVLTLLLDAGSTADLPSRNSSWHSLAFPSETGRHAGHDLPAAQARGPPVRL